MFSRSSVRAAALAAVAGLALPAAAAWAGPVQIISQERSVRANAQGVTEEETAPDAGPFDEAVSSEVTGDGGALTRASASMNSTLGDDAFTFSGTLSYATDTDDAEVTPVGNATATAIAAIVFELDESRRFELTRETTFTEDNPFSFFEFPLEFTSEGGPEVGGSIEDVTIDGNDQSGTLTAGRYRLLVPLQLNNEGGDAELRTASVDYDVTLEFSAVDGGGGGGGGGEPNPIPLPPAAWAGLATFACWGAGHALRRRTTGA